LNVILEGLNYLRRKALNRLSEIQREKLERREKITLAFKGTFKEL
jgi:hypothetical protein